MKSERAAQPRQQSASTHIAKGSKVKGEISGDSALLVEGEIDGHVKLDNSVIIGPSGRVKGEISARNVQISGKVKGNVRGREKVEIVANGSLEGDVSCPRVVIADGAFFKGQIEMAGEEGAAKTVSSPREKVRS